MAKKKSSRQHASKKAPNKKVPNKKVPSKAAARPSKFDDEVNARVRRIGELLMPFGEDLPSDLKPMLEVAIEVGKSGDMTPLQMIESTLTEMVMQAEAEDADSSEYVFSNEEANELLSRVGPDESRSEFIANALLAIKADPHSIDAYISLGMTAATASERVRYFQQASAAAVHHDEEVVAEVMPFLRIQMANILAFQDSRLNDAAEILAPALVEDPEDYNDVRYRLIDMYLRLGWDDVLENLLKQFEDDDDSPLMAFAAAILEYMRFGASERAKKLLQVAHHSCPELTPLIAGVAPMLEPKDESDLDDPYSLACYLLPGLSDIEGATLWIRDTIGLDELSKHIAEIDNDELEDFHLEELSDQAADLPQSSMDWWLVVRDLRHNGHGVSQAFIAIDDRMLAMEMFEGALDEEALQAFLLRTMLQPRVGEPARPARIVVLEHDLRMQIRPFAKSLDIECDVEEPNEVVQMILEQYKREQQVQQKRADLETWSLSEILEEAADLPVDDSPWILGIVQPPIFVEEAVDNHRPWMMMLLSREHGTVENFEMRITAPEWHEVESFLLLGMLNPQAGTPRRPSSVLVEASQWREELADSTMIQYEQASQSDSDRLSETVSVFLKQRCPVQVALWEQEGVDREMLADFYRVAAGFCRSRPWKMVAGDRLFQVYCADWDNPTWAVSIMGQLGQERGVAVYESPKDAIEFLKNSGSDPSKFNSAVIHFSEPGAALPMDLWYIERNGWEVAGSEGWPFVARLVNGSEMIAATATDLKVLTAVMAHSPRFLDVPEGQPFKVKHDGSVMVMSWLT